MLNNTDILLRLREIRGEIDALIDNLLLAEGKKFDKYTPEMTIADLVARIKDLEQTNEFKRPVPAYSLSDLVRPV